MPFLQHILILIFSVSALAAAPTSKDPAILFQQYVKAGDLSMDRGEEEEAAASYQQALDLEFNGDKSPVYLKQVLLLKEDKKKLAPVLEKAQGWFAKYPKLSNPEIKKLLEVLKSYVDGRTILAERTPYYLWTKDKRIEELMTEGNSAEAWDLIRSDKVQKADLVQRVRYDLLATSALRPEKRPGLTCEEMLKKRPKSFAYGIRICRYLTKIRSGEKNSETPDTIEQQLKIEAPEKLYWMKLIRNL